MRTICFNVAETQAGMRVAFVSAIATDGATSIAGAPSASIGDKGNAGAAYILNPDTLGGPHNPSAVPAEDGCGCRYVGRRRPADSGALIALLLGLVCMARPRRECP